MATALPQGLRDALREPAVLLAGDEHRVEHRAAVVHRDVPHRRDAPGVEVDLDHRDVRAEGVGRPGLRLVAGLGERHPLVAGRRGHLAPLSARSGTPARPSPPSTTVTSAGSASRAVATTSRARASTVSAATSTLEPASCSEREPPVPPPRGTAAVSDCTNRTCSMGMPRRSATIIANDVACPWPCAEVPTDTVAPPSASTRTAPYS